MAPSPLPIQALPLWSSLNNVSFKDVSISDVNGRGLGLVASSDLTTSDSIHDTHKLLTVPRDLVLNAEAVEQYAKEDKNFRQLLDAVGHKSTRLDILLFLLVHLALGGVKNQHDDEGGSAALSGGPWTTYIKFLPRQIPLPSLWTELERSLLRGTSLEDAVQAKLTALEKEFDDLREKSSELDHWDSVLWDNDRITLSDWLLVDAWFRSRSLELPRLGTSMVPCIDMVNHTTQPSAIYDESAKDDKVVLLLRPGKSVATSDEVTISYGCDKSPAEMLFSYGFIDSAGTSETLVMRVNPFAGDPLAKAKSHIFEAPPTVKLQMEGDRVTWNSDFAYLVCVNEEDGLDFRVLRETDGARSLRLFWKDQDVTAAASSFKEVVKEDDVKAVIELRVVTVIQGILEEALARMQAAQQSSEAPEMVELIRDDCSHYASLLRQKEGAFMERALETLEQQRLQLLADPSVGAYLGSMEATKNELVESAGANEEDDDDFS